MKKCIAARITAIMFTLAFTLGPCTIAMATESANATRNSLKSQGNIVYTDGENSVGIYSDDLYMIADQLDSYKTSMTNQLAKIHTYFTSNTGMGIGTTSNSKVNVTHTKPEYGYTVDSLVMDFDTLLEGLAASQSIPTDVTEYGYSSGQKLYKTDGGSLTTSSSGNTEINITAATASNLSAGTAAWVNGNLILGTGADNTAYYDTGYKASNVGYNMSVCTGSTIALDEYTGKTIMLEILSTYYNTGDKDASGQAIIGDYMKDIHGASQTLIHEQVSGSEVQNKKAVRIYKITDIEPNAYFIMNNTLKDTSTSNHWGYIFY